MLEGTAEDAQRAEGEAQVRGDRDARETTDENAYRANLAPEVWQGPPREPTVGLLASCRLGAADAWLAVLGVAAGTHLLRNCPL